jgi:hypothetical protein
MKQLFSLKLLSGVFLALIATVKKYPAAPIPAFGARRS